ncbi:TIGR04295 family B12-binding domain-containing radical SAM protein [Rhodopila sp.]|jgi:B12-binding domain/radical SAM domain protein of rhizo-twelve system|uniref:TIGR04295 family B12-binding domain-containing radical SAM protein n=1 Tax=Rhodopila sp. TaxID=2480087 RepID=UPI002BA7CA4E|nr:TIGR04295 family B12-binding domain-containing radical SAM protein [Rhodopila sp.]HVZ07489.1 TIGR04295 family B12-binding domain-containing radical SAM protein [Rhodopila sp.]
MRLALINPPWNFEGSIYFGCREPHLPLELGYAQALLRQAGHETLLCDAHLTGQGMAALCEEVAGFTPDITVVTTAPSYLFWRCAPPELRVPSDFLRTLDGRGGRTVAIGPHGSVTPAATLRKLRVDAVVRGECEEVLVALAGTDWRNVTSLGLRRGNDICITGGPAAGRFTDLPALHWPDGWIQAHHHHHHRFDSPQHGPGAEVEASRGCPFACSFCAKIDFRDRYRRRDLDTLLQEIDTLAAQGVTYLYFIDEIFLPQVPLLKALEARRLQFGIQTRIDLWKPDLLRLLGAAGCVSIEAGVESLTEAGRDELAKNCRLSTDQLAALLVEARRHVPFVQANLIGMEQDDPRMVARWREQMNEAGVWSNEPVPLYPYPSSPSYRARWGEPDDLAWERAHAHYLAAFDAFSDIQTDRPLPLAQLEAACQAEV